MWGSLTSTENPKDFVNILFYTKCWHAELWLQLKTLTLFLGWDGKTPVKRQEGEGNHTPHKSKKIYLTVSEASLLVIANGPWASKQEGV